MPTEADLTFCHSTQQQPCPSSLPPSISKPARPFSLQYQVGHKGAKMFEYTSRYYKIDTATTTSVDGQTIVYKRRRFLPQGETLPLLDLATVTDSDRLDLITARTLGDPEQFWRIADANNALNPADLTATPGRVLRVPLPQP